MYTPGQIVRVPNRRLSLGTIKEQLPNYDTSNPFYQLEETASGIAFKSDDLELLDPEFELQAIRDSLDKILSQPKNKIDYRRVDNLIRRELFLEDKVRRSVQ